MTVFVTIQPHGGETFVKPLSLIRSGICLVLLTLGTVGAADLPKPEYHLLKKISFSAAPGGREYYDYLTFESSTRRLYLSHGTEVKVVNADTGETVGTISNLNQTHGILILNELGKGFITDGGDDSVVLFDLATLKITGRVKTVAEPDCITYDSASNHVFVFNGHGHGMTVIDPQNGAALGIVPMGGTPESAVADGKGLIFDNNQDTSEVVVIDSRSLTIKVRWPIAPAGSPTAMAMDREHRRLFISGRDPQFFVVMSADTGKIIQSFPISAGVDANVFEPDTGLIFTSTRDGLIHIFHEDSPDMFSVAGTIKTEYGAKTMALDPKTHNIFVTTSDFGPPPPATPLKPNPQPDPMDRVPGTFRLLIYGR
ncbi:MAG: YVTN family beta-propeller domain-containing protein [Acidobacteria bacterium]|nr:MAG: YVTN family beta-propeller domain-containing protein [Acidobacteriota bacterium]